MPPTLLIYSAYPCGQEEKEKLNVIPNTESAVVANVSSKPVNEVNSINKKVKSMSAEDKKEPEYVDFAITARKYKTLLTNKYKNPSSP